MTWLFLVWSVVFALGPALAAAHQTTTTQLQCQTFLAAVSPSFIASHTATITTTAPGVTVAFSTRYTTTLDPGSRYTTTGTTTVFSTVIETVTEVVQGSVFSTTSTVYGNAPAAHNVTSTIFKPWIIAEQQNVVIHVPTPSGFHYLAGSRVEKRDAVHTLMGLRGALWQNSAMFPSLVSCTKSFVVENTAWRPSVDYSTNVAPTPVSRTITVVSTLTTTSTVLAQPVSSTETFVVTSVLNATTTHEAINTAWQNQTYTVHSTSTSYQACATSNMFGPKGLSGSQIVNIYTHGPSQYTLYNKGFSTDAEQCCKECHTMSLPCMGSIFTNGQCLLLTHSETETCRPGVAAGYYVTQPKENGVKPSPWWPGKPARKWPQYVLSNGPCGAFEDGGTGW